MIDIYYQFLDNPSYSDRHAAGRALLQHLLHYWQLADKYPLSALKISPAGKPYFGSTFDFSIAHSENLVVCAGIKKGRIGMDAEYTNPVDLALYQDYISHFEWRDIYESNEPEIVFYNIWVRKEAVLKATGRGIFLPMREITAFPDKVSAGGGQWHLYNIHLGEKIIAYIATDNPCRSTDICLHKIDAAE